MSTDQYSGIMCSWCGRIKDDKLGWIFPGEDDRVLNGPLTSHGLCDECYANIIDDFLHISKQPSDDTE